MIDKIFDMIIQEARKREGPDLSWKLLRVCAEIEVKIMHTFEELNPNFNVWETDDEEDYAQGKLKKTAQEVRTEHDRSYLRRHNERGQESQRRDP